MYPNAATWLDTLEERARAAKLSYLDLLVDATALDYPLQQTLQGLPNPPVQARLLEGTPEAALAFQGPILLRLHWADPQQKAWLLDFAGEVHREHRVLALLSDWPFDRLAKHLSHCTQAEWEHGASSGLLRYYDPRLFLAVCEMLDPAQSVWFHAPALAWHWVDRDGKATEYAGVSAHPADVPAPLPPMRLNKAQVDMLLAWTAAEAFRRDYALIPQHYGLAQQESLIRHLMHAQLAADRAGRFDASRDDYVLDWLAANSTSAPSRSELCA